jgi:predicted ATP-grasp superfamily ATP-dependent carboligase
MYFFTLTAFTLSLKKFERIIYRECKIMRPVVVVEVYKHTTKKNLEQKIYRLAPENFSCKHIAIPILSSKWLESANVIV